MGKFFVSLSSVLGDPVDEFGEREDGGVSGCHDGDLHISQPSRSTDRDGCGLGTPAVRRAEWEGEGKIGRRSDQRRGEEDSRQKQG